jgi:MurNAc alpha-1-phosphate uridylyltransferase
VQAVILAGGLATRLGARAATTPKSLLPVAGRPFLDWQLAQIASCGFTDAVLCLGHLGDAIRAHLETAEAPAGLRIHFSEDGPRQLGTAGALRRALPLLAATFLVTYGDSFLPFDYGDPLRDLEEHPQALGTLSVFPNAGRWDASNVAISGERVLRYAKGTDDPSLDHIDYGAMALRRAVVAAQPPDVYRGLDTLQTGLAAVGRLRALVAGERFYEIGSPAGLAELEQFLASRR